MTCQGDAGVYVVLHEARQGPSLLVISHLGDRPCKPTQVSVDTDVLPPGRSATIRPIEPNPADAVTIQGRRLEVCGMLPLSVTGFLIG
jgi:hypothetical protein